MFYSAAFCRFSHCNISLDIRYCLFIIDKFAGARHLVDEMTIVQ
ncbi:MAG: S46 family peptidase [Bacteroidales bacterium]|nr:S46 family peptidase [Bacteroidales bacterium]